MPRTVTVRGARITLDLLLWRAYGQAGNTDAMLAAALALNPGLAARGAVIQRLTIVTLPDPPSPAQIKARKAINLFGD